eukprot:Skav207440  [mRNA]  locus=scaffold8218:3802:7357:- [translate_table: standard]
MRIVDVRPMPRTRHARQQWLTQSVETHAELLLDEGSKPGTKVCHVAAQQFQGVLELDGFGIGVPNPNTLFDILQRMAP